MAKKKEKMKEIKRILYISKSARLPRVVVQGNVDIGDAAIFAKQTSKIFRSRKSISTCELD